MMKLNETISKLSSKGDVESGSDTATNNETEDIDEFVDATDKFFEKDEDDVYDNNVQFIVTENNDYLDDDMDAQLHEIGLMLNSTLASDYDGANAARLNAHFFNDWRVLLEKQAIDFGFPNLEELLKSEYMKEYVEQTSSNNGVAIYGAVSKLANEHILRRVADCKLNEDQKAEKRKMQRLMELKNPENARNFLEGKRRILKILLDLKAYKTEVDYQTIRNEYMKLYNVSLNASEHQRLFMNKSALKNFWRAFYREVILINDCPIRVKLRSPDIKIPEEIAEDIRLLANIDKIELPTFVLEYRPTTTDVVHKGRTAEYSGHVVASGGNTLKKPIMESKLAMDLEEELEYKDRQLSNEKQCKSNIGNADGNSVMHSGMANTMDIPVDMSKVIDMEGDGNIHNGSSKPVDLNEDKYTGDEESTDSSDSEVKVSKKYQKKKFRGNINTFNISSPFQSLLQILHGDKTEVHSNHLGKDLSYVEQSVPFMDSGETRLQSGKRLSVAERALQQSLSHSYPRKFNQSPSSSIDLNNRSSTRINGELNNLPFGSYSVPNSAAGQCISRQEKIAPNSTANFGISTEENTDNYRKTTENVQKPFSSHSRDIGYLQEMQTYQSNRLQQDIPSWSKEVAQLSEGTQTDENWLENLLDELGCRNLKKSPLQKLIEVVELVVDIRSPNPVLLSSLPQIVGSFYGTPLNPEKDQNYRITWREIVRDHCSAEILIAPLPNGEVSKGTKILQSTCESANGASERVVKC